MTAMTSAVPARRSIAGRARAAFRTWRRSRPFWAGVWTMAGAFFITYVPATGFRFIFSVTELWLGVMVGVMIGVFGLFLWIQPQIRALVGVLIIGFSMVSFVTSDFGGLFVGMLLGLIGGSMAMAWGPPVPKKKTEPTKAPAIAEPEPSFFDLPPEAPVAPAVIDVTDATRIDLTEPATIDLTEPESIEIDVTDETVIDVTEPDPQTPPRRRLPRPRDDRPFARRGWPRHK